MIENVDPLKPAVPGMLTAPTSASLQPDGNGGGGGGGGGGGSAEVVTLTPSNVAVEVTPLT
jgi:hypothetical protein